MGLTFYINMHSNKTHIHAMPNGYNMSVTLQHPVDISIGMDIHFENEYE